MWRRSRGWRNVRTVSRRDLPSAPKGYLSLSRRVSAAWSARLRWANEHWHTVPPSFPHHCTDAHTHTHTHTYDHAYIAFFLLLSRIMSVPLKRDARQTNRSWNVRFNERAIRFARLRRNLGEPRDFYIIYLVVLIYQLVEEFSVETNFNV